MSDHLAGLIILEMPGGVATRYCGRLFAAHGATVLQCGVPDETGVGYGGAASAAYVAWLDGGKHWIAGDVATAVRAQDPRAILAGQSVASVEAVDAALASLQSEALRVGLTWFAPDGPYRNWTGSDAIIQAMSAVAFASGPKDGAPMLPRGHAPQIVAGATAFIATLAAILGKDQGWQGSVIDLNVFEANLCFAEGSASGAAIGGFSTVRRGINRFSPTFPGGIYQASDGFVGVTTLTPAQWLALCDLLELPEELKRDPYLVITERMERADELDKLLVPALKKRTANHWLEEGQRRRIPIAPVPSLSDLPRTAHWQGRASFAEVAGTFAVAPDMPFYIESGKAVAPAVPKSLKAPTTKTPSWPLEGLRVLDLSMGWSGPLTARHLADLGADIVKVESCSHMDWWRGYDGPTSGDPPPYEIKSQFLMVNRNKRGVTLDLKTDTGKALVRRLAVQSDIIVENYAPGVLDKLGLGAASLAEQNPALVSLSMGAFGSKGPWRGFRAYGSTVEQASGLPFVNGEPQNPPTMQHVAYGDPVAGLYGTIAVLIALYDRQRRNAGAIIDLSQVECLFQLCADAIVAQSVQTGLLAREGNRHPLSAVRAVVDSRDERHWIAVSVETVQTWNALARIVGCEDLVVNEGDVRRLKPHEDQMERAVRTWAKTRDASDAVAELQQAGVASGLLNQAGDLLGDAQLSQSGFWRRAERRYIGSHVIPHAPYTLDGARPPLRNPSPTLGEHNDDVLGSDLGLSRIEIDKLLRDGVIGNRAAGAGAD